MPVTRSEISASASALLAEGYEIYIASNRAVLDRLDTTPFGLPCTAVDFLATGELAWQPDGFMRVYNRLNALCFGTNGIAMEYWVMIDLGLLSSAFVLIALPRERLVQLPESPEVSSSRRAELAGHVAQLIAEADERGFDGPIPVAGYCAAPTPEQGRWVGWSLCSVVPGLGTIAKGLALEVYGASTLVGVTQYDNPALHVHRKFGPMRLLSAVLDLHPREFTFVYHTDVYGPETEQLPTTLMDSRDRDRQRELQAKIDAGEHTVQILWPGLDRDGRVPIFEAA